MPSRPAITDRGFTLLEVLVASVILTLGLVLALQGITAALTVSQRASRRAAGQALAADMLSKAAAEAEAPPSSGDQVRDGTLYAWRLAWDTGSAHPTVSCRVEWVHRGVTHSVSMSQIMASPVGGLSP